MNAAGFAARATAVALTCVVAAACSTSKRDAQPPNRVGKGPGNPPFYEVFGERYYVMASAERYDETGVASWYGPKFHGKPTSTGERFDMYAMTAAHKTLPLPTRVRVTNLANGRSVDVKVNDRGPFVHNRIIDLSYAAAEKLGMIRDGTAMVRVRVIEDRARASAASRRAPVEEDEPTLYVQVGAFGEASNAERMRGRFRSRGVANVAITRDRSTLPVLHRVRIGPLANVAEYDRIVALAAELNIFETHLVVESDDPS